MERPVPPARPTYDTALGIREMLRLLEATRDQACGVNELAEELGVSRRTVRRWAAALAEQLETVEGVPQLAYEPGTPHRRAVVRLHRPRGTANLAQQRAAALALAATRYLCATGAEPLETMAASLVRQSGVSDDDTLRRLRSAFHYIPFGRKSYAQRSDEVDDVFTAVISRWTLDFDYNLTLRKRGIRVRAEPYSLVIYRDALYMLARRLNVGEPTLRVYAIDRMSCITPDRKARFAVPDDFDPATAFGDLGLWRPDRARERVEILFDERAAVFVQEREWPGQVAWRHEPDGRHRLVLDLLVSPEVEQWLLGFGPDAEVVAPDGLRDTLRRRAEAMAARYRSGTDAPSSSPEGLTGR